MKTMKIKNAALIFGVAATLSITSCGGNSGGNATEQLLMEYYDTDIAPVCDHGTNLYGFVDKNGTQVITPRYRMASYFHEGMATAQDTTGLIGYIDKKGRWVIEPQYASATDFNEGKAWMALPDSSLKAIDKKGKVLFSLPQASAASLFIDGMSYYDKTDGSFGLVSDKGVDIEIPAWCTDILFTADKYIICVNPADRNHLCRVVDDKIIDLLPDFKYNIKSANVSTKTMVIEADGKYGLADFDGKLICNPQYQFLKSDADLYLFKNSKDKLGWLNAKGEEIIAPKYKDVSYATRGMDYFIVSTTGSKWQIINSDGKTLAGPKYDNIRYTRNKGIVTFLKDGEGWGIMTQDGTVLCKPQFENIRQLCKGVFMATSDGQSWGVIDEKGTYLGSTDYKTPGGTELFSVQANSNAFDCNVLQSYVTELISKVNYNTNFGQIAKSFSLSASDLNKGDWSCRLAHKNFTGMGAEVSLNISLSGPCLIRAGYSGRYDINKNASPMEYWITLRFSSLDRCVKACDYLAKANNEDLYGMVPYQPYFLIAILADHTYHIIPNESYDEY